MIKRGFRFGVVLLRLLGPGESRAEELTGNVMRVIDGDTVDLSTPTGQRRIRLFGIDAPEIGQPSGSEARKALSSWIDGQSVVVKVIASDRHGRTVGQLFVKDIDVSLMLIQHGWAWHSSRHNPDRLAQEAEQTARRERRGLWRDPSPLPPWQWRRDRSIDRH